MQTPSAAQTTAAVPMQGWTAADLLNSAKRIREYEMLSLADDWAAQLEVAAKLIDVHVDLVAALKDVLRIAKAASIGVTGNVPRIARAEAALIKAGAL